LASQRLGRKPPEAQTEEQRLGRKPPEAQTEEQRLGRKPVRVRVALCDQSKLMLTRSWRLVDFLLCFFFPEASRRRREAPRRLLAPAAAGKPPRSARRIPSPSTRFLARIRSSGQIAGAFLPDWRDRAGRSAGVGWWRVDSSAGVLGLWLFLVVVPWGWHCAVGFVGFWPGEFLAVAALAVSPPLSCRRQLVLALL
jgi:hypothetical protein